MPKVKLVSITKPLVEVDNKELTPEQYITYIARISNPKNQCNLETSDKLLKYCIKHNHWSIFEQVDMTVEIVTSRAIAAQLLRHKSAVFQEYCMSGDTEVYFDSPSSVKNNKRKVYKKSLEYLYNNWNKNDHLKNQINQMNIRVLDESTKLLTHSHISNIFKTGIKPIFEVELYNGKKFKCTREHKVYSAGGFVSLEEGAGLQLINKTAVISNKDFVIGCNGIPVHQSKEWLEESKIRNITNGKGLVGIAEEANVSYHTIRKWLRVHNLQFSKTEVSKYTIIWNKGKYGYTKTPHSIETIQKMRDKARKGENSNLWKGGVQRSERLKIADWCNSIRAEKLIEFNYKCKKCNSNKNLELDHILPVYSNPELSYSYNNIQVLCHKCHVEKHNMAGDRKHWIENRKTTKLTLNWSKIKSVKYIGEEMTYDLEVEHTSHNYVANGVIVHNSQRYAEVQSIEPIEFRLQDTKNRQNSLDVLANVDTQNRDNFKVYSEDESIANLMILVENHLLESQELYNNLLAKGVAKESARMILPLTATTKLYMKNNLRNWIHYIEVRALGEGVQKEHREIALLIQDIFKEHFSVISKALNW